MIEDRRSEQMITSSLMMMDSDITIEVERSGSMRINMKREQVERRERRLENSIRKEIKILSNSCNQPVLWPTRRN
jgi:hypothetical protein